MHSQPHISKPAVVVAMASLTISPVAEIFPVVLWHSICKTLLIL